MIDHETIKRIALECGFKLREQQGNGRIDLNEYVYDFAERLFAEWSKAEPVAWTTKSGSTIISAEAKERLLSKDALGGEFSCAARTAERYVQPLYTRPQPAIPPVLFDGYAVYQALGNAQAKTSPKNVSDVLDAVVRLIRAEAPEATK